jgi:hypothetical protein
MPTTFYDVMQFPFWLAFLENRRTLGAVCCTTRTGTFAARAASIASPTLCNETFGSGYSIGKSPVKYSFCTSITTKARLGAFADLADIDMGFFLHWVDGLLPQTAALSVETIINEFRALKKRLDCQ